MNKLLRMMVSAALLWWVARDTDWSKVGSAFAAMNVGLWTLSIVLLIATQVVSAWRWQYFANALGFKRSVRELSCFYYIGMYFNLMLPTSVGGDVVRAWYLDGGSGRRLASFAAVFLDRLNGLLVLIALAVVGVLFCPLDLPSWMSLSVFGVAATAAAGIASLPLIAKWGLLGANRSRQIQTMLSVMHHPRILVATTLLSVFVQVSSVVQVWLIGSALGAAVPASFYWILVPLVGLLTLLPSINGVGVREKSMTLLLGAVGVANDAALTLAFLWFAMQVSVSLMGGLVYLFGHFPKMERSAQTPAEVDHGSVDHHSDQGRAGQLGKAA